LSTPVRDLSGGQQRRLQLLLILLEQPNVLILDEPTNDMDTDMLAVIEDLLDSWPGTLIVVSHDRYFIERVTDGQYAILDGRLRHLPGGIYEYLRLRSAARSRVAAPAAGGPALVRSAPVRPAPAAGVRPVPTATAAADGRVVPGSAAERAAKKELDRLDRQIARAGERETKLHAELAANATDYARLTELGAQLTAVEAEKADLEERWLEVASSLEV
jgi:ABC transport system ATP-binding/permease protein